MAGYMLHIPAPSFHLMAVTVIIALLVQLLPNGTMRRCLRAAKAMLEAIQMVAQTEGLLLDPVYSGKAMAALIGSVRRGKLTRNQNVVFLHTGGSVGLFGYTEAFAA